MQNVVPLTGTTGRHPPFSIDAETAVIGSILTNPDRLAQVHFLREQDFYFEEHQRLWEVIHTLKERGEAFHVVNVARNMPSIALEGKNVAAYLASIASPSWETGNDDLVTLARLVMALAQIRRFNALSDYSLDLVGQGAMPAVEIVENLVKSVEEIRLNLYNNVRNHQRSTADLAAKMSARFEAMRARPDDPLAAGAIPTFVHNLDVLINGLYRGDTIMVGGRTRMGKTSLILALLLNIARESLKRGLKIGCGLIEMEMREEQIGWRASSNLAWVNGTYAPYNSLMAGKATAEQIEAFNKAQVELSTLPLEMDFTPKLAVAGIMAKARALALALRKNHDAELAVLAVDQLMCTDTSRSRYAGNKVQEYAEIMGGLHEVAVELDVALIVGHQLKRQEGRLLLPPTLQDLRDSGATEDYSDSVWLIWRKCVALGEKLKMEGGNNLAIMDEMKSCRDEMEVFLAKQRMGPEGWVKLDCRAGASWVGPKFDEGNPPPVGEASYWAQEADRRKEMMEFADNG